MTNQQPSSYLLSLQAFYKSNLWRGRFMLAFITIIVLLGMMRLALPQTIIFGSTSWLKKQGIKSSIESINIDILNGTVSLINAKGSKGGEPLFNVGLIDIHWHWAPLSDKTIVVTKVALDQFTVKIEQYTDKIIIGGVNLPVGNAAGQSSVEENKDTKLKPWAASLGEVVFTELNICYLQHSATYQESTIDSRRLDYCIDLDEMTWGGTISYATNTELLKTDDLPLSSTGDFALNGLTVTDNKLGKKLLVSASNALKNVVISGLNNIHIDSLNMSGLSALQRKDETHKDALRFHQLSINAISLVDLNSLSITDINITEPGLYLVKNDAQQWEHQQWIPQSPDTEAPTKNVENNLSDTPDSIFKVSINNISVENNDSCYLQKDTGLYYCFIFERLNWNGNIQYDTSVSPSDDINLLATGDLRLSRPNIRNLGIDRSLVNFSSLELTKLNLSGLNSITLDALKLSNFAALQRSKETNDNTASFDTLIIEAIKYTKNNISINAIDLQGLANTISKNTNGEWEHDKWWITNNKTSAPDDIRQKDKETDQNKSAFMIALNKVNISSDKNILFIDNSTQPATEAGLQKLTFDISSLYSAKPDSNSPFKLYARTSRHSTVDIKGTARPFADKVSFAADGKLKGFDLRAASPTIKKAIGHIIQSGQLDADLNLKAVDGVLDSNIALSLYQFKIKPVSKADADKLDKLFGMPLNQTLVLLREKDDSIHLDIPITGDVNNPDFNPMDAVIKATSKAATVTLITFYTPYGLIYAGGNLAFNLATALNFDPIEFNPGSAEVQAGGKDQLDKLSKLLVEKPQVHLTLCGITNQQDVLALYPDRKTEQSIDSSKNKNIAIAFTSEQTAKLAELASERQINSKNYLVSKHGIDHDRLILCEPEHKEGNEAVSGVEVNI
jgi:hypothetical protein